PAAKPREKPGPNPAVASKEEVVASKEFDVPTLKEIADFQASHPDADRLEIVLKGDWTLTGDEADGDGDAILSLLAPTQKLTLRAQKDGARPVIHILYRPHRKLAARWIGILLRAKEIKLEGLCIAIDGAWAEERIAGIVLQGEQVRASNCEFIQVNPAFADAKANPGFAGAARMTTVLVDGSHS